MKSIIVSGSSGQIGSYLTDSLQNDYVIHQLSRHSNNPVDALDEESVHLFFENINSTEDVVAIINCVGGGDPAKRDGSVGLSDISKDNFSEMLQSNLVSLYVLMKEYIDVFRDGNIVNISSVYGCVSPRTDIYGDRIKHPGYVAAKFGLIGLTKYMSVLGSQKEIKVNCVSPGAVVSTEGVEGEFLKKYEKLCPLGRGVSLSEIHNVVKMLCDNNDITGQNIIIDAGYSVW